MQSSIGYKNITILNNSALNALAAMIEMVPQTQVFG